MAPGTHREPNLIVKRKGDLASSTFVVAVVAEAALSLVVTLGGSAMANPVR